MFQHDGVVVEELWVGVLLVLYLERVRQKRMPVVEGVELGCYSVLILKPLVEEQLWIKLQLEVVTTQMLYVVLNHNLDGLSCFFFFKNIQYIGFGLFSPHWMHLALAFQLGVFEWEMQNGTPYLRNSMPPFDSHSHL